MPKKGRLSEDDKLLQRTGHEVSATAAALFYGHAIIVSALPLCKHALMYCWYTLAAVCNSTCGIVLGGV